MSFPYGVCPGVAEAAPTIRCVRRSEGLYRLEPGMSQRRWSRSPAVGGAMGGDGALQVWACDEVT